MARTAEPSGHTLPGSHQGSRQHSGAHQVIAVAAGSSLGVLRLWHKQGCADKASKPCPAQGGGSCPCSICTPGLLLGAAVYLLSPAPAPQHPTAWLDEAGLAWLPWPQQERRSHGFPRAWSLLCPSAPAWASQHWEDPRSFLGRLVPSCAKASFPVFPDAGAFPSLPTPSQQPSPMHAQRAHLPIPAAPKGLMPFMERPPCPSVPPLLAGSTSESCHFTDASPGNGAAPLLLLAEPPRSRLGWCRQGPAAKVPPVRQTHCTHIQDSCPGPAAGPGQELVAVLAPLGEQQGSQVTAMTLQIPGGARSPGRSAPAPSARHPTRPQLQTLELSRPWGSAGKSGFKCTFLF